ncbi:hypothetical protein A2U01_0022296, partial [Trifolium medium]|nr:hypothetical protein [Trifolium medium]
MGGVPNKQDESQPGSVKCVSAMNAESSTASFASNAEQ